MATTIRQTVWANGDVLTAAALNAEIDNLLTGGINNINNANIAAGAAISPSKIAGTALVVGDVIDEDTFSTDSASRPPSQQSTKAYVQAQLAGGWSTVTDTFVYASATTITIAGVDRTTTYTKGTRIKLTQTTVKYFTVLDSAFGTDTTITVTGGSDYTLANAAITLPFYSYQANPQGYPTTFAYSPLITGTGGTIGTYATLNLTGYFSIIGNQCTVTIEATITNKGSWSGDILASLPVTASVGGGTFYYIFGWVSNDGDASTTGIKASNAVVSNSSATLTFEKTFGTAVIGWADVTATCRVAAQGVVRF